MADTKRLLDSRTAQQLDIFFKPEPFDLMPDSVRTMNGISSQSIHFVYRARLTQRTVRVLDWTVQMPTAMLLPLAGGMLALMATLAAESLWAPAAGRSWPAKLDRLQRRWLHAVGLLCQVFPQRLNWLSSRLAGGCFLCLLGYWLAGILVTSMISVGLVLPDLRDVKHSLDEMSRGHRRPCWMTGEKYIVYFTQAPRGSLFERLWTPARRCTFAKDMHSMFNLVKKFDETFGIGDHLYLCVGVHAVP